MHQSEIDVSKAGGATTANLWVCAMLFFCCKTIWEVDGVFSNAIKFSWAP